MAKKTIEEILRSKGIISDEQIKECQLKVSETGLPFTDCLIGQHYVTPEDIARAYAEQTGYQLIEKVTEKMADPALLAKIPLKFLRQNVVMPVMLDTNVTLLTANPTFYQPLDELNMLLGGGAAIAIATPQTIIDGINRYYPLEGTKQMIEELEEEKAAAPEDVWILKRLSEKDILGMASEAPIIKLVNHIFFQAVKRDASDIHIEPFEKEVRVRYRIDGVMYPAFTPPKRIQGALISRIKIMANMNIAEKRLPQDGRIQIKVADKAIDIRVSVLPVSIW